MIKVSENGSLEMTGVEFVEAQDIRSYTTQEGVTWLSRDFVVLDNSNPTYPDYHTFSLSNRDDADHDNVTNLKFRKAGDNMKIVFRMKGRKYLKDGVTKYFSKNEAFMVMEVKDEGAAPIVQDDVPAARECP